MTGSEATVIIAYLLALLCVTSAIISERAVNEYSIQWRIICAVAGIFSLLIFVVGLTLVAVR